jgi:hypothetical protein
MNTRVNSVSDAHWDIDARRNLEDPCLNASAVSVMAILKVAMRSQVCFKSSSIDNIFQEFVSASTTHREINASNVRGDIMATLSMGLRMTAKAVDARRTVHVSL